MRFNHATLAFTILILLTLPCAADSQARIVRLSYLEGNVQLDRGDGSGYIRAFLNMPLIEGTTLWTRDDARAEVEFEDGSTLRLTPDSIVQFRELRLRSDGSKATAVELKDGSTYFNLVRHEDDSFRVLVGLREIALERSSEFRLVHAQRRRPLELEIALMKGELRFLNEDGQRVSVRKNETLTIDFDDAGRYFLAKGIAEEAHDYWNREREKDHDELARRAQRGTVYLADLSRYGTYVDVIGYGRVWRPFSVSIGWDPFSDGAWIWYPGTGYVWVSNYVWGWTPYRYGSWVHIGGRGWCWRPDAAIVYTSWVPRPVIVNPPPGYVAPIAPVVPAGNPRARVIRVGRGIDEPDFRDDRRHRESVAPGVLVQDRVRGVRQVDGRPTDRLTPIEGVRPTDRGGDDTPRYERDRRDVGDRPVDGQVDTRIRTRNTGEMRRLPRAPRDGEIDPNHDSEPPQRTARPAAPLIQDRPARPSRLDPGATPNAPVMQDRPSRPARVDSPPPQVRVDRVERAPERSSPPPQSVPMAAPPRSAPPPSPPPSRNAPVPTGVKDQ